MEQTSNQISEIMAIILAIALVIAVILFVIYAIIYTLKTDNMQRDYIKQLNEHDKAVIMDYKNCHWSIKKKKKNQPKNEKI